MVPADPKPAAHRRRVPVLLARLRQAAALPGKHGRPSHVLAYLVCRGAGAGGRCPRVRRLVHQTGGFPTFWRDGDRVLQSPCVGRIPALREPRRGRGVLLLRVPVSRRRGRWADLAGRDDGKEGLRSLRTRPETPAGFFQAFAKEREGFGIQPRSRSAVSKASSSWMWLRSCSTQSSKRRSRDT